LLDISQMDAGQFSVTLESVDAGTLIREAHTLFVSVAEEKRIRLECRPAGTVSIKADQGRIMQVLSNLIGNALKFVPAGGTITIGAEPQGRRVRFSVVDTGICLSAEDQPRVFDRFWRGDRRKDRGAGLGLAVAKGIIEAHDGEIGVDSALGQGCTFYFLLHGEAPAAADFGPPAGLPPSAGPGPAGGDGGSQGGDAPTSVIAAMSGSAAKPH
jgi:signal transduction histidine kinase